ncbi:MAG: hypothetical protein PVI86_09100 [Phycisphaerae bacterium]
MKWTITSFEFIAGCIYESGGTEGKEPPQRISPLYAGRKVAGKLGVTEAMLVAVRASLVGTSVQGADAGKAAEEARKLCEKQLQATSGNSSIKIPFVEATSPYRPLGGGQHEVSAFVSTDSAYKSHMVDGEYSGTRYTYKCYGCVTMRLAMQEV